MMDILRSSWNQSLKSSPFVFKKLNQYFGFYFIGLGLMILAINSILFPSAGEGPAEGMGLGLITMSLLALSQLFTAFIVISLSLPRRTQCGRRPC